MNVLPTYGQILTNKKNEDVIKLSTSTQRQTTADTIGISKFMHPDYIKNGLDDEKIQNFQIRITVHEARQLFGNNLKPVCKIKCASQYKHTKIVKSSANPLWNELFFFNFSITPKKLFYDSIEFKLYNSNTCRKDSLIGGYKLEIGSVYDELLHSLIKRWLLLTDQNDLTNPRGYLKVSISVIGAGDEPPNLNDYPDDESEV